MFTTESNWVLIDLLSTLSHINVSEAGFAQDLNVINISEVICNCILFKNNTHFIKTEDFLALIVYRIHGGGTKATNIITVEC